MEFNGGQMMDLNEEPLFPMGVVKEERFEFDEEERNKGGETSRRGRTRSLTKKSADKVDIKAKLERSRQSARECRARKKLRYQYLEEIISETEKSINTLRREMDYLKMWAKDLDEGRLPPALVDYRRAFLERKLADNYKLQPGDVLMEEQGFGQEVLRHVQPCSSSPTSSGIASASTSAEANVTTMAFSPTSSAFAAMMLSPSSLTHTISPS